MPIIDLKPPPPVDEPDWIKVLDNIANGIVPSSFCAVRSPMPDTPAVIERKAATDSQFAADLAVAKRMGAIVMLAECKQIADDDTVRADQRKIQIDTRMKIAAIWNPEHCNPKTLIEQTTTVVNLTPKAKYIQQMTKFLGMTEQEAAARYDLETGATLQ